MSDHHHHDHDHDHEHHHGAHPHSHAPKNFGMAFAVGTALNTALVVAELGFGVVSGSLALISDGIHNLSDVAGLLLAWGGAWLAGRQPTTERTYGFRRASILAALGNAALLFEATGAILVEAVQRLLAPSPVATGTVIWVASAAAVINTATALMFMRGREHDVNIKGAFLHMAGDAAASVGVVLAAIVIAGTGWTWIDPFVSIAVGVMILVMTWSLSRETLNLALDGVPAGIDTAAVKTYLGGLPGVIEVHDLHIWAMSTTETALTVHLVRPGAELDDHLLATAADQLRHGFGIHHATVQVECGDHECRLAPAHVV